MLMPKRVKYRKTQRRRVKGKASRGNRVCFGDFGLQAMEYSSRILALGSVIWVLWIWCAPASILTVALVSLSSGLLQLLKAGI